MNHNDCVDPKRLKSVFDEAFELDGEQRSAFLDKVCQDDVPLRTRVNELLEAYPALGQWLDTSPVDSLLRDPLESTQLQVGPYRVVRLVGEGGFGHVFLAEQLEPIKRQVALKVIKPGMASPEVIGRFEAERQALAIMKHPNIASIFDAGTTTNLRPYFAMEFVDGETVVDHCSSHGLSLENRLKLFVAVCGAVAHAHQKGVIHRDLKPSNILVASQDMTPKVIDFGVAKAISPSLTQAGWTSATQLIGTPNYMSPEQAGLGSNDIDTRSDIYSLGVLLYELLTGSTPHDSRALDAAAYDEMRRIIREEEPPTPSKRLSESSQKPDNHSMSEPLSKTSGQVPEELDWIAMKALSKDRSRRYRTVDEMADDVRRFLRGEAVEARAPSSAYRFRKFVAKHRVSCTSAALVALAFVVSWLVSVESTRDAKRARQAENVKRRQSDAIKSFLVEMLVSPEPHRDGRSVKVAEVLDRAVATIDEKLGDDRLTKAHVLQSVAKSYFGLGLPEEYLQTMKAAAALVDFPADWDEAEPPVQVELASAYYISGNHGEAARILERLIPILQTRLGRDHDFVARAENALALSLRALGNGDAALRILERLYEAEQGDQKPALANNLAMSYLESGMQGKANQVLKETLSNSEIDSVTGPIFYTSNLSLQGYVIRRQGQIDEGLNMQEKALLLAQQHLGHDHGKTLELMNNLAMSYAATDKCDEAIDLMRHVVAVRKRVYGPTHRQTLHGQINLAAALSSSGQVEEAIAMREKTIPLLESELGPQHSKTLKAHDRLARDLLKLGDRDKAIELMQQVFEEAERSLGCAHFKTARAGLALAATLTRSGRGDEAVERLKTTLAASNDSWDPDFVGALKAALMDGYVRTRQLDLGLTMWNSLDDELKAKYASRFATTLEHTANQLFEEGDPQGANAYARRASGIRKRAEQHGR